MTIRQLLVRTLRRMARYVPHVAHRARLLEYVANLSNEQAAQAAQPGQELLLNHSGKPRLFHVSPLPPDHTGIAGFSLTLLGALARHFQVIPIHPHLQSVLVEGDYLQVKSPHWMLNHATAGDVVVYHLGNSPYHSHMLGLMKQLPGFVVLHDVFLSHLLYHEATVNYRQDLLVEHLYASHGQEALLVLQHEPPESHRLMDYPCSRQVVTGSRGALVYSSHAQQMIRQHYGANVAARVNVLNMPVPAVSPGAASEAQGSARQALGEAETTWLVCCFGLVQESKCTLELIEAWVALGWHQHPDKQLVFVGGCNPEFPYSQRVLAALAALPKTECNIQVTGWVNDTRYQHYLQACSMAVQLRRQTRGETSAALLNTLACGVPTLVNAHGSMAEIPSDVVHMLPDSFTPEVLQGALAHLYANPALLASLREKAARHVRINHSPEAHASQFATLLLKSQAEAQADKTQPVVWVDCSLLYLPSLLKPAEQALLADALNLLAQSRQSGGPASTAGRAGGAGGVGGVEQFLPVQLHFVRFCPTRATWVACRQVHRLPPGGLAEVFHHNRSQLPQPSLVVADRRVKRLVAPAAHHLCHPRTRLVYFKSMQASTAERLCDQLARFIADEAGAA